MTPGQQQRLTCVFCGCDKDVEFFDGWRSCIGAPGLSGKVDIDRPECDHCVDLDSFRKTVVEFLKVTNEIVESTNNCIAGLVSIEEVRNAGR